MMTRESLVDLTLTLCCEADPLDHQAMWTIDRATLAMKASVALILFSKLSREQKIDIARRVEEIEQAMGEHV